MTPEQIIELRMTLGVTQERFAALLQTTACTINRWEKGKSKPSRLYLRELREIKANNGSYICRRTKSEES